MMPGAGSVDAGLRERFRAAGAQVSWRDVEAPKSRSTGASKRTQPARKPKAPPSSRVRIAHLHDEEARIEETNLGSTTSMIVDSGPVGALILLLELERRGPPALLTTRDADPGSPFPQGAIEARWNGGATEPEYSLPMGDLIQLARYALA
jgi:hypothetical protein